MREGDIFLRADADGVLVSRKKDNLPAYEPSQEVIDLGVLALRDLGTGVDARQIVEAVLKATEPRILRSILPAHRLKVQQAAQRETIEWMAQQNYLTAHSRYSALRHYHLNPADEPSQAPRLRAVD